jgi:putative nucleotidyltransferase with HDIG domain
MEGDITGSKRDLKAKSINIPSPAQCLSLLKQYEVYPNIISHSKQVTKVAMFLAKSLKKGGIALNLSLIEAGALLHDIGKTYSLKHPGTDHIKKGSQWLEELGYPQVAEIVRQHVDLPNPLKINEKTIVSYADKRVKHDIIVSLEERFSDLLKRYGQTESKQKRLKKLYQRARKLEALIFSYLPFNPDFITN